MRFSIRLLLITTAVAAIVFYFTTNLFPSKIHSIHRYSSSKNQFPPELVSHFPAKPPSDSSNPIFSFYPGMLQAGAWLQLRIETSKSDAENLANRLNAETTHIYTGGSFFTHYNLDPDNNWPTALYHTQRDDHDAFEFPSHFTLYVHHAKDGGGGWNHGETAGTAVSLKTNEIIYWAESW